MKRKDFGHPPGSAVEAALGPIDGRWIGVCLFHLESARGRPTDGSQALCRGSTACGDIALSEIGESLRPVIDTLKGWGGSHQEGLSWAPPQRGRQTGSQINKAARRAA